MSNDAVKAINEWIDGLDVDEDDPEYDEDQEEGRTWDEVETLLGEEISVYITDSSEKYGYRFEKRPNPPVILQGFGRLVYVDGYTGGEGGGEDAHVVVKLVADDGSERYFRKQGYYASHYGTDWDGDLVEVIPYTKTVTFYDKRA